MILVLGRQMQVRVVSFSTARATRRVPVSKTKMKR